MGHLIKTRVTTCLILGVLTCCGCDQLGRYNGEQDQDPLDHSGGETVSSKPKKHGKRKAVPPVRGESRPSSFPKPELVTHSPRAKLFPEVWRELKGHARSAQAVAFSPNAKRLASVSRDGEVKIWNAATGDELRSFRAFDSEASWIALSPDGKTAAVRAKNVIKLLDAATGRYLRSMQGEADAVRGVAKEAVFSPDGARLFALTGNNVEVYDVASGRRVRYLSGVHFVRDQLAVSPDGRKIVGCDGAGTVTLVDVNSGQVTQTLQGHDVYLLAAAFSPDGK
ncbi:MAG: hypothetical protein N2C14_25860, partial [Planctomycetales bacterium]